MKKIVFIILIFTLFISLKAEAADWDYRTFSILKWRLNERWSLAYKDQSNFRDDMHEHFMHWFYAGFDFKAYDWLDLGFWYRRVREKSASGGWDTERRPMLDLVFKTKINKFNLSNRCRFERRDYKGPAEDDFRYRNEIKLVPPVSWTKFKITPYIEDELFYGFNEDKLGMHWLTVGLSAGITKNIKTGISYRFQDVNKPGGWESKNVLGTTVIFLF